MTDTVQAGAGTVVRDASIGELLAGPERWAGDHLLVHGERPDFTLDRLEALSRVAVRHGIRAAISVPGRRASASPTGSNRSLLISAVAHRTEDSDRRRWAAPDEALGPAWAVVGVIAHGDGMHVNLGGAVLCGLIGRHERTGAGPVPGGCTDGSCKKDGEIPSVVQAQRVRCDLLVLLSCTSMLLARQLYPSDLSMALAAWTSGGVRAVIGTTRQAPHSDGAFTTLLDVLRTGATAAEAVLTLNGRRDIPEHGALVLLGEPDLRLPEVGSPGMDAGGSNGGAPRPRPPAGVGAGDLVARCAESERLERAVRLLVRQNLGAGHPLLDRSAETSRARAALSEEAWNALAFERMTGQIPATVARRLGARHSAWAAGVLRLLAEGLLSESHPGAAVGDLLQPALPLWLVPSPRTATRAQCPSCRGTLYRTELSLFVHGSGAGRTRVHLDCNACGTAACWVHTGQPGEDVASHGVPLRRLSDGTAGSTVAFELRLPASPTGLPRHGLVQARDKSRREALPLVELAIDPSTEVHRFGVALPPDAGSDLCSVRAVVVADGALDYYRCVFPIHRAD